MKKLLFNSGLLIAVTVMVFISLCRIYNNRKKMWLAMGIGHHRLLIIPKNAVS